MYRTIQASFWTDPKVKKLTQDQKLMFLYLITNPHTHVSGIYFLDLRYASADTGWDIDTLSGLLDTLSTAGLCRYDAENSVVWVIRMMKYQGWGKRNHTSAAYHLVEDLHKSCLCREFVEFYPEVLTYVPAEKRAIFKTKLDTVSHTLSIGDPPVPLLNRIPIPIPEQEQKQDPDPEKKPNGKIHSVVNSEELDELHQKFNKATTDSERLLILDQQRLALKRQT